MSNVNGLGGNSPVYKITNNPIQRTIPTDAPANTAPARGADRLELSGLSDILKAAQKNDIRADKVAEMKAAIAAGNYETDEKMDVAVDRLLDDLLK
jgi:negative regulator of flagellin synthesis FlgM